MSKIAIPHLLHKIERNDHLDLHWPKTYGWLACNAAGVRALAVELVRELNVQPSSPT